MATASRPQLTAVPDLEQLARDPALAASLPPEVRNALIAKLIGLLGMLAITPTIAGNHVQPANENLLTAEQVAARWEVPESWVREQARTGKLPCLKLGHYRRFRAGDVDRFIRENAEKT
ncbi:MAG: helix-turn-helix domain-containing protein [Candidatus Binataceae bacterium]|jgi:excisionase family DNA binding protein